jgi:hypothetical protein
VVSEDNPGTESDCIANTVEDKLNLMIKKCEDLFCFTRDITANEEADGCPLKLSSCFQPVLLTK